MKIFQRFKTKGEKRRFLVLGIFNFFITTITLQVLLLLIPTFFATIFSQLVNVIIGYYLYGKKVFKINKLNNLVFKKYLILASILWILNFSLIQSFFHIGVNKNMTAVFILPLLVVISYLSQRNFVFK